MLVVALFAEVSGDGSPDRTHLHLLTRSLVHSHDHMVKTQSLHSAMGVVPRFYA
jgi:hypothetical protein